MSPKKVALWFLIVSVALSAALGILAIVTGNFGDFEMRIILTTLTISAASIGALAAGALWEGRRSERVTVAWYCAVHSSGVADNHRNLA